MASTVRFISAEGVAFSCKRACRISACVTVSSSRETNCCGVDVFACTSFLSSGARVGNQHFKAARANTSPINFHLPLLNPLEYFILCSSVARGECRICFQVKARRHYRDFVRRRRRGSPLEICCPKRPRRKGYRDSRRNSIQTRPNTQLVTITVIP